jgi:hypothetical protein
VRRLVDAVLGLIEAVDVLRPYGSTEVLAVVAVVALLERVLVALRGRQDRTAASAAALAAASGSTSLSFGSTISCSLLVGTWSS